MSNSGRSNSSRPASQHMESPYTEANLGEEQEYVLPPNGLISSIIIGSVGGMIALAVPIIIVLTNTTLFSEGARLGDKMPGQVATAIVAWQCIGVFIDLFIAFAVGMIAGKIVVKRKLGFLAGVLVGGIVYLGIFFVHYIPGYPDIINSGATNVGLALVGLLAALIPLAIYALAGGLMSLWGAWVTTRRHPYYYSEEQEPK
jgi:hypothetical protein